MSEGAVGWLASLKLLSVVAFATLYWLGGRRHKVLRRWVGGVGFGLALNAFALLTHAWRWPLALTVLAYPAALHMGYGGDTLPVKFWRRLLYGAALGAVSVLAALPAYLPLAAVQLVLAIAVSVGLGLTNPVKAAEEEALIALGSVVLVPFML